MTKSVDRPWTAESYRVDFFDRDKWYVMETFWYLDSARLSKKRVLNLGYPTRIVKRTILSEVVEQDS